MPKALLTTVAAAALLVIAVLVGACQSLDDDRIPPCPVNLAFTTQANWNIYGVTGAMDYKKFIRDQRIPSNFPYAANSYTGFAGILLVANTLGEPMAYDLACPVERMSSVRIDVDPKSFLAECPQCHSKYDVFSLPGHPVSGPAADKGYGLKVYHVGPGQIDYMLVSF